MLFGHALRCTHFLSSGLLWLVPAGPNQSNARGLGAPNPIYLAGHSGGLTLS